MGCKLSCIIMVPRMILKFVIHKVKTDQFCQCVVIMALSPGAG